MLEDIRTRALFDTVVQLDTEQDGMGLIHFIQSGSYDLLEILLIIPELVVQMKLRPAFALAMLLRNNDFQNPILSGVLYLGGWLFDNPVEERFGLELLQNQAEAMDPEQRQLVHDEVLKPVLWALLDAAISRSHTQYILKIFDIYQALFPELRPLLDPEAPVPALVLPEVRRRGRARASLPLHPLPPPGTSRPRRRVLVAMRQRFYFGDPASRLSDFGPRIMAAMTAYGWDAACFGWQCATQEELAEECRTLVERCRQHRAELLIIDLNITLRAEARDEMILQLRRENPGFKVVGCLIDAFCFSDPLILRAARHLDLLWTRDVPGRSLWRDPAIAHKVVNLPIPHAGFLGSTERPLQPPLLFSGGVSAKYLPHRAFWLAALQQRRMPVRVDISDHQADALSPLDSFACYMRRLNEATCCLSLSMRYDHSHVVTFRSFEVVWSGALLVQEATAEMDHYWIEGEHYLGFSTLAELESVIRFMTEHREEAEEIRRRGHAFARERYSDAHLIGHLDWRLFFPAD